MQEEPGFLAQGPPQPPLGWVSCCYRWELWNSKHPGPQPARGTFEKALFRAPRHYQLLLSALETQRRLCCFVWSWEQPAATSWYALEYFAVAWLGFREMYCLSLPLCDIYNTHIFLAFTKINEPLVQNLGLCCHFIQTLFLLLTAYSTLPKGMHSSFQLHSSLYHRKFYGGTEPGGTSTLGKPWFQLGNLIFSPLGKREKS